MPDWKGIQEDLLFVLPTAWRKIHAYAQLVPADEVQGLGTVRSVVDGKGMTRHIIEDVAIVEQVVSPSGANSNHALDIDFPKEFTRVSTEHPDWVISLYWHSHGKGSPGFSPVDEQQIEDFLNAMQDLHGNAFLISVCVDSTGMYKARMDWNKPCVTLENVEVKYHFELDNAAIDKEVKEQHAKYVKKRKGGKKPRVISDGKGGRKTWADRKERLLPAMRSDAKKEDITNKYPFMPPCSTKCARQYHEWSMDLNKWFHADFTDPQTAETGQLEPCDLSNESLSPAPDELEKADAAMLKALERPEVKRIAGRYASIFDMEITCRGILSEPGMNYTQLYNSIKHSGLPKTTRKGLHRDLRSLNSTGFRAAMFLALFQYREEVANKDTPIH